MSSTRSETPTFALGKIQPPRPRAGLVARPALERALGLALERCRLTLLLAPAGYGKTAALTRQIRQLPPECALAWVTVDEGDPLQRFLSCLAAALEPHDLPWRVLPEALGTLALAEQGVREVAVELVNALASAEAPRGVIVIDDAHRVADPRVFELLQRVLDRLPGNWALVIASRVEPPLALARLRADGELAEFRQHELRFSETEIEALLNTLPPDARQRSAHELLLRTDGWAAGLRLSLAARPGQSLPGQGQGDPTQRHLFDYLATEVLDEMPAELRLFLLRCSILPELTPARCAFVTGMTNAARWLDEVERRGLFVSVLDADELTLRLHDLFRAFLEEVLRRERPDELNGLWLRAAETEPDLARAVSYLARAGAWDDATRLLAQRAPEQISIGGHTTLIRLLALFPEAEAEKRPDLAMVRGLCAWPRFDWDTLLRSMQEAARGYLLAGRHREAALARVNACSGLHHAGRLPDATEELTRLLELDLQDPARAFVQFSQAWDAFANARVEDVAPHYARMLDTLDRVASPMVLHQFSIHFVFVGLPGMQPLLERFAHNALRVCGDTPTQLRAGMMHLRCWLALSQGKLSEAWRWLGRGDDDCRWLGAPRPVLTENRAAHALLLALRGEAQASHAAARDMVTDIELHSPLSHRRVHAGEVLFLHARAAWILQDADVLRELDAALERAANAFEWTAAPLNRRLSRAFVALIENRLEDACELLRPLADDVDRSLLFPASMASVLLADARQRLGDVDGAAAALRPWLARALATGEVGAALLAGPHVIERLAGVDWRGRLAPQGQLLWGRLALMLRQHREPEPEPEPVPREPTITSPAPLSPDIVRRGLGALSEREREVLERIAAGDSNKLIARAFDLSPHTVKRHVANILAKLGVDTRGQAAARWRA